MCVESTWSGLPEISHEFYWQFSFLPFIAHLRVLYILANGRCTFERENDASPLLQARNAVCCLFTEKEDVMLERDLNFTLFLALWEEQHGKYDYSTCFCSVEALQAGFVVEGKLHLNFKKTLGEKMCNKSLEWFIILICEAFSSV